MILETSFDIWAYHPHSFADTKLHGFTPEQEKKIKQVLSRVPLHLQTNFKQIVSAPGLGAIHGRYLHHNFKIQLNPNTFTNKVTFGTTDPTVQWEFALLHEIGHSIRYHMSKDELHEWLALSGWKKGTAPGQAPPYKEVRPGWPKETSEWTHAKDAQFARRYERKSPDEDFSDSFAYLYTGNGDQVPEKKRKFIQRVIQTSERLRG
jgi:hypothetical protein